MKVVTLDSEDKVHDRSPRVETDDGHWWARTVLLRVDRTVPWRKVESLFRSHNLTGRTIRIAYRGDATRERFLPCSATAFGFARDAGRYEFEVLRIRLVLQADGIGRCGEERIKLSRVSSWCTRLHERAAEEKVDGLIIELEIARECSWGRVAHVFEQVRAAGVSAIHVLVRQLGDPAAAMSTGGVEFNIYPGDASTANSRRDEFMQWFPWREPDEDAVEEEEEPEPELQD